MGAVVRDCTGSLLTASGGGNSTNENRGARLHRGRLAGVAPALAILRAVTHRPTAPPAERGQRQRTAVMSRRRFLELTDLLIADGERLIADPDWNLFRLWLLNSDELLERVWGRMDRYHLAWLNVGRDSAPSGSPLDVAGTRRFVSEVAAAKVAVLRTMRIAVDRHGWTSLGDDEDGSTAAEARRKEPS